MYGQNTILKCLGKEEAKLHLDKNKDLNDYKLNQKAINFVLAIGQPSFHDDAISQICNATNPTRKFIELLFKQGINIASTKVNKTDFGNELLTLHYAYLTIEQEKYKEANCLEKNIPELVTLNEKLVYLSDLNPTYDILFKDELAYKIFTKIQNKNYHCD